MPHYIDKAGGVHFLDDAAHAGVLPAGCIEVSDSAAAGVHAARAAASAREEHLVAGRNRLVELDQESIRSIRAKLLGIATPQDDAELARIESDAAAVRATMRGPRNG